MYPPGLRLRQFREKLKLTYREVEKASYVLAAKRGRREFILHISRLADMENRNVVPSLHKLYSLAVIYHVDAMEIASWYEAPFLHRFQDESTFPSPVTHMSETRPDVANAEGEANFCRRETELLKQLPPALGSFLTSGAADLSRCRYGYVGLRDRRMVPILRPGSIVLVDTGMRSIEDQQWWNEYDRPLYFVELKRGIPVRVVPEGTIPPDDATARPFAMRTGSLANARRSGSRGESGGAGYVADRAFGYWLRSKVQST